MDLMLTILDLRTTPIWPSFEGDPERFPDAGRVQAYLENNGVVFPADGSGGVQVFTDGTVQVTSITDPTPAWNAFSNQPSAAETLLTNRLQTALEIRNRLADGTATAADLRDGLRIALMLILRLYQKES